MHSSAAVGVIALVAPRLFRACLLIPGLLGGLRMAAGEPGVVIVNDTLRGETAGEQVGGTLTAEGYRPGLGQNHILYRLPHTVRDGYVEFEVKGMNAARIPVNADHAFMAMYDGRGVDEPAQYFRDLRENFFRWNVHWRQNRNALKCVISCATPGAERGRAMVAQYAKGKRDWSQEPTGATVNWDPNKWYRFRVEWRNRVFRLLVDGEEKWRVNGVHDYAPADHRVWLGSAPANRDKYRCHIPELIYRNFRLIQTAPVGSGASGHLAR